MTTANSRSARRPSRCRVLKSCCRRWCAKLRPARCTSGARTIARHSFADPLKDPGLADVTAHVDFQALARAAEDVGARVHGPVLQGDFLKHLGIESRAVTLMAKASHEVSEGVSEALKRLIGGGPGGMGSLFKVIGISDPDIDMLVGLSDDELRAAEARR
jgi:NADH dehydrogenase [ubiquinone] 1 alpha subcomplex assembly factor 7